MRKLAMFDADNLVHPDFIACMNDYLEAHPEAEAVQGYLETKNPSDTWITRSYALSYWYLNRFWSLARAHWGLSVALGGTGFVIRTPALSRSGWELHSLTEDLELTIRIVLQGGRIHWNDAAWVYDEKPLTLAASLRQRTRWVRGQYWVLWRYAPAAVSGFLRTGRWQHLDLLVLLATPLLYAAGYLATLGGWAVALLALPSPAPEGVGWLSAVGTTLAVLQALLLTGLAPLLRFGRWDPRYLLMLLPYTFYVLTWAWPVFTAPFQAHDQGNWAKTPHTRALRLEELDG
ncbi:glycosyltransferase family 2 protein [Meiothermus granaticius]|nr:glycosyltransferase family 2 protein [Meiothermus granaticius]GEM86066.1 hypothetical protein MGR01S_06910 [Meiothermus granaticius NBRC 107808]